MRMVFCLLALLALSDAFGEEYWYGSVAAKRLEQQFDTDTLLFDLEAYYGNDQRRGIVKLEGENEDGGSTHYELELLYGKPISPFFDLLFGVVVLDEGDATTTGLTVGLEGEARYRIHLETFATVTEDGDTFLSLEAERAFLLTEKWSLVPRVEIGAALSEVDGVSAGFSEVAVESRLHYVHSQRLMPYIGLSWQRSLGDEARLLKDAGEEHSITTALLGLTFWF